MRKIIALFLMLTLLQLVSAVEITMKENLSQGETMIAKVSGNFLNPFLKENIFLYRGHVRVPFESEIFNIEENYYFYGQLSGKSPGNYSIILKNVKYMKGDGISEDNIIKNFSISEQTADFSVKPGVVITSKGFFIDLKNLQDNELDINVNTKKKSESKGFFESFFKTETGEETFLIKPGETKKISFDVGGLVNSELKTVEISSKNSRYEIPVYLFANQTEAEKEKKIKFDQPFLNVTIPTNSNTTRIIYLRNLGSVDLENISLSASSGIAKYIKFSTENIGKIKENSSYKIEVYLYSNSDEELAEGQINAKYRTETENLYSYLPVYFTSIRGYIPLNESIESSSTLKTCSELGMIICKEGEECDDKTENAKDGVCCAGNCNKTESSSTGKIVGWIIIILLFIFVIWFFKFKYRKAKKEINLFEIARKR